MSGTPAGRPKGERIAELARRDGQLRRAWAELRHATEELTDAGELDLVATLNRVSVDVAVLRETTYREYLDAQEAAAHG
jgi:hypothetical protein